MPPYGLYSLANTPEELLSSGYGTDYFYDKDPAFGQLVTERKYLPAPFTGERPFQNLYGVNARGFGYYGDLTNPSFGGSSNIDYNQYNPFEPFESTGIMKKAPYETFSSLPQNLGVATQADEETEEYEVDEFGYRKEPNKLGGILDLLAGIAIPGYGILKNVAQGGFEGLRGLGGRLGQSDFAQSKTHMEFLDRIRNKNARTNDSSAADLQTEMANRSSAVQTDQDRGRGDRPGGANRSTSSRGHSYSRDSSSFGKSFHG